MHCCQPQPFTLSTESADNSVGCASCCGIFNLDISHNVRQSLLTKRTQAVQALIRDADGKKEDFFRLANEYRAKTEAFEGQYARFDKEIYVCVFLGHLSPRGRMGCLIHPDLTSVERSQNAGFYGHSICQTYDCRTKDSPDATKWARLCLDFVIKNPEAGFGLSRSEMYSLLMADSLGRHLLGCLIDFEFEGEKTGQAATSLFLHRFDPQKIRAELLHLTSLEVNQEDPLEPHQAARRLAAHWAASPELVGFWQELIFNNFCHSEPPKDFLEVDTKANNDTEGNNA